MPPYDTSDITLLERPPGARWTWPVHHVGTGRPVIVLHELFGMSPMYLDFCRRLAGDGFSVWMPQLVGSFPSESAGERARAVGAICVSREFDVLRSGRTSRVVAPLRRLAEHLSSTHGGGGVGVVGMCFSGGFALAMAADAHVTAAVAAQPALPARPVCGRALGLSDDHARQIRRRLTDGDVEVLYTRFARDPISPRGRLDRALDVLGAEHVTVDQLPAEPFRVLDHSVLTQAPAYYADREPQAGLLAETADRVSAFLRGRLGTP